jgi:hypothetical protein
MTHRSSAVVVGLLLRAAVVVLFAAPRLAMAQAGDKLIAIDILLEADRTLVAKASAINARMRTDYPAGYSLDARDFAAVTAAVTKLLATERPTTLELTAKGLTYTIWNGVALNAIVIERTPELMRLQQKVADAVAPFAARGGTETAFIDTPPGAEIVTYVETFVPKASGAAYLPHVTAGTATEAFAKQMKAEPFEAFTFRPGGVAIYQLGNFGTASKKLWQSQDRASIAGRLDRGLDEAAKRGWVLVDMAKDWAQVFPSEKK